MDVKLDNVHLRQLNALTEKNVFSKNDLYVNTLTLWDLMQTGPGFDSHNYHGLTPEEIVDTLANITQPYCVIKTEYSRYEILATTVSHFGEPLLVIVEVGSGLGTNPKANINKLITIYPKSDIDKTIEKTDKKYVLYIKK